MRILDELEKLEEEIHAIRWEGSNKIHTKDEMKGINEELKEVIEAIEIYNCMNKNELEQLKKFQDMFETEGWF